MLGGIDIHQRTMARRLDLDRHGLFTLHPDHLLPADQGAGAVGRGILPVVEQGLDEEVLGIGIGRGEAPGDMVVAADDDDRHARRRRPSKDATLELDLARYQVLGRLSPRCGSLASRGFALSHDPVLGVYRCEHLAMHQAEVGLLIA